MCSRLNFGYLAYLWLPMEKNIVLSLDAHEGNGRNSEGAFLTLNDGRIAFVYSRFLSPEKEWEDHDPSLIAMRLSHDGGLTWDETDSVLIEPYGALNVMSVSLLRLPSGRILLCYTATVETGGGYLASQPMICFSDDELQTLSTPLPITSTVGYYVINNDRVIQLQSGRLVIPVALHRHSATAGAAGVIPILRPGTILFLLSDDDGMTWRESAQNFYRCFPDGHGLQEPGVIELEDGRLWCWSRTGWCNGEARPRQWQAFSRDGGETWTEPEPSQFVSPRSPLSMKRIPATDDLLAVWNDHSGRFPVTDKPDLEDRTPLVSAISNDEGITWHSHRAIEDAPDYGFCYTAIHFVGDDVLLAYCAGGPLPQGCLQRLRISRVPLAQIYEPAEAALST